MMNWQDREDDRREDEPVFLPNASRLAAAMFVCSAQGIETVHDPSLAEGLSEGAVKTAVGEDGVLRVSHSPINPNSIISTNTTKVPFEDSLDGVLEKLGASDYSNPIASNYSNVNDILRTLANSAINHTEIEPSIVDNLVDNVEEIHHHLNTTRDTTNLVPSSLSNYDTRTLLTDVVEKLLIMSDTARMELEKQRGQNR